LNGFPEEENLHQHAFFGAGGLSSINSYGYSPYPLSNYLAWIKEILAERPNSKKPFIISITGSSDEVEQCFLQIQTVRNELGLPSETGSDIAIEINLSCPNIPRVPPPAYSTESLLPYLIVTKRYYLEDPTLTIGLKLPPYTYETQFNALVCATWRKRTDQGIAFLTSTNTLGSGLVFQDQLESSNATGFAVSPGWGGLGGTTIHPLSVGNVAKLVSLLETPTLATKYKLAQPADNDPTDHAIVVIGVGGINDGTTYNHFRSVGAVAGEVGTALGVEGVVIFEKICRDASLVD